MSDILDKIVVSGGEAAPVVDVATDTPAEPTQTSPHADGTAPQHADKNQQDKDGNAVPDASNTDPKADGAEPDDGGRGEPDSQRKIDRKINKLVSQREKQRARAEMAEQRAVELQKRLADLEEKGKADRSAMTFDERINHDVELATERKLVQREIENTRTEAASAKRADWDAQVQDFMQSAPDFQEVVGKADIDLSPVLHSALVEMGPSYVYALAKNPEAAARISKTSNPVVIATILNGLTAQIPQPQAAQTPPVAPPKVATTPAPNASASIQPQRKPWELDIADYMASQRKKGLIR